MNNNLKDQKNVPELNILKVLIQLLEYQHSELDEINQKIDKLKSELNFK